MPEEPLLQIKNLGVDFHTGEGVVRALRGVDLSIGKNQTLGLVGESGSGKSVTALAVLRLLPRKTARMVSGSILFNPEGIRATDLSALSEQEMQRVRGNQIAMIFQEPMTSLNPVQRCGWQIMENLIHHFKWRRPEAKDKTLALLEEVRLPDPKKAFLAWPHEMSGGQRQRIMIAMALACNPALLIADEPTTALDVTVQKGILDLLARLQQDHGMSVLFVSHDLALVSSVTSNIAVMLNGSIVEAGMTADILSAPKHPYTRALISCRPHSRERLKRLPVVSDFLDSGEAVGGYKPVYEQEAERKARHKLLYAGQPVLEVRDLQTTFVTGRNLLGKVTSRYTAVSKISFDVYQGETLGLVGESGCGKTTLGRSLMRLIEPDSGSIRYRGSDISGLSPKALRMLRPRFQIIFQDPLASLTPGITIGSAILEPMRLHGIMANDRERRTRIMELLERVGLETDHYFRYPHQFSGGQRQRICIARALALKPEFIICDESVSALDVSVQAQVLNLLNDLKGEFNLTYLFISHDLAVVRYMADRVLVMKQGSMVELNESDALYSNPENDYTRRLIASIPTFRP